MATDGFLDIDRDTLCAVLERDTLCSRESRIFTHVHHWAENDCKRRHLEPTCENKRNALGDALHLVRFPIMTAEEFANDAAQTGLLDNKESVSLFLWYLATPKPLGGVGKFSTQPRCCTVGRELFASRFQATELRWGYSGLADKIKFQVTRPIYIVGFGLYGNDTPGSIYKIIIQLIHCETREVLGQNEMEHETDGSKKPYLARFPEPIAIDAETQYVASATIRGPDTYYGTRGLRKVSVELRRPVNPSESSDSCTDSDNEPKNVTSSSSSTRRRPGELVDKNVPSVTFSFTYASNSNNGTGIDDGQIPDIAFFA